MEKHRDMLAKATRQRAMVEDAREVMDSAEGIWKAEGRIAPYVYITCGMIAGTTLNMILSDGSHGVADLSATPVTLKHVPK